MMMDMDERIEQVKAEQQRIIDEEVPSKIGAAMDEILGSGWMLIPSAVERYADIVMSVQAQLSAVCEACNQDYEDARRAGFPDTFKPIRH